MPALWLPSGSPARCRHPRYATVFAVLALATALVSQPARASEGARPVRPAMSATTAALRAAQVKAGATGERQEIESARTAYDTTYVNPSGTTTRVLSAVPVRTRGPAGWTAIDTTLVRHADGGVAPRAALLDVTFSGGGTQPLARIRREAASVSLDAPWTLPTPVLTGDVALYREVLPGVDLAMKAEPEGYREVLVVKNHQAATQAALRQLRFALRSDGANVVRTEGGGLAATDRFGTELLSAAPPAMWDSSSGTEAGEPPRQTGAIATSIVGPAEGDRVAPMDLAVDAAAVQAPRSLTC